MPRRKWLESGAKSIVKFLSESNYFNRKITFMNKINTNLGDTTNILYGYNAGHKQNKRDLQRRVGVCFEESVIPVKKLSQPAKRLRAGRFVDSRKFYNRFLNRQSYGRSSDNSNLIIDQ